MHRSNVRFSHYLVILVAALATTASASPGPMTKEEKRKQEICDRPVLVAEDLPRVLSNMPCDLTGAMVEGDAGGAVIPPPGTGMSQSWTGIGGGGSLTIETADDGTVKIVEGP